MDAPSRHPSPQRFLAAGFLLAAVFAALAGQALMDRFPGPQGVLLQALGTQGFMLFLALAGEALLRPWLPRGIATGRSRLRTSTLVLLAVGFVLTSHAASIALSMLELRHTSALAEIDRVVRASTEGSRPGLALALLAIGLAPAVAEELLFRGLIQGSVRALAGPVVAVAVSSLVFAGLHLDLAHSAAALPLGVYLGLVALLARSVRAPMLCHAVNNSIGVLFPAVDLVPGSLPASLAVPVLLGLGAAALAWSWRRESGPAGTPAPRDDSRE